MLVYEVKVKIMGAQPNNTEPNINRTRKYDTYTPRIGDMRRNNRSISGLSGKLQPARSLLESKSSNSSVLNQKPSQANQLNQPKPTIVDLNTQFTISKLNQNKTLVDSKRSFNQFRSVKNKPKRALSKPTLDSGSKILALRTVGTLKTNTDGIYYDENMCFYVNAKKKMSKLQTAMYGFAVVVLLFSGFVSMQSFTTNNQAQEQIATLGENVIRDIQGVSEGTGNEPSEEPVSESVVRNFIPANPEDPRFLRIPSLGVFSRIKTMGVTPEGAVDAPRNIFDSGWYDGSARPGSKAGSSLILGHVSGWTGPGVFKNISKLAAGSVFEIEKGTGEIIKYSVIKSEELPVNQIDMSKVLSTEVAGEHDVKLMTCSGRYNSATETFEDRFLVYAKQI